MSEERDVYQKIVDYIKEATNLMKNGEHQRAIQICEHLADTGIPQAFLVLGRSYLGLAQELLDGSQDYYRFLGKAYTYAERGLLSSYSDSDLSKVQVGNFYWVLGSSLGGAYIATRGTGLIFGYRMRNGTAIMDVVRFFEKCIELVPNSKEDCKRMMNPFLDAYSKLDPILLLLGKVNKDIGAILDAHHLLAALSGNFQNETILNTIIARQSALPNAVTLYTIEHSADHRGDTAYRYSYGLECLSKLNKEVAIETFGSITDWETEGLVEMGMKIAVEME